jgi:hypothetical protein
MWLILLKKYWEPLAIIIAFFCLWAFLHHTWYGAGYSAATQKYELVLTEQRTKLSEDTRKALEALNASKFSLAKELDAKEDLLAQLSAKPKVLTKTITKEIHDGEACTYPSIGDDFERVWNDSAKAYDGPQSVP